MNSGKEFSSIRNPTLFRDFLRVQKKNSNESHRFNWLCGKRSQKTLSVCYSKHRNVGFRTSNRWMKHQSHFVKKFSDYAFWLKRFVSHQKERDNKFWNISEEWFRLFISLIFIDRQRIRIVIGKIIFVLKWTKKAKNKTLLYNFRWIEAVVEIESLVHAPGPLRFVCKEKWKCTEKKNVPSTCDYTITKQNNEWRNEKKSLLRVDKVKSISRIFFLTSIFFITIWK